MKEARKRPKKKGEEKSRERVSIEEGKKEREREA